jgi:hypothetical protein
VHVSEAADIWANRDEALAREDLVGFTVLADDEPAGSVARVSYDAEAAYIIVAASGADGRRVVVPTGVIAAVDADGETVRVRCSRAQLEGAPEESDERMRAVREGELGAYWGEIVDRPLS